MIFLVNTTNVQENEIRPEFSIVHRSAETFRMSTNVVVARIRSSLVDMIVFMVESRVYMSHSWHELSNS